MENSSVDTKKISKKDIETVFKEIKRAEKIFTPIPSPENLNNYNKWIVVGGSSRQNNKLIEVSAWQTGQTF